MLWKKSPEAQQNELLLTYYCGILLFFLLFLKLIFTIKFLQKNEVEERLKMYEEKNTESQKDYVTLPKGYII
jgi:hypothetical protein